MGRNKAVDCNKCKAKHECCMLGAWVDLEEAKKILELKIKGGDFFHLEKDKDYPSGYRIGTSIEDEPCTFITKDGLCSIHKIDYNLKPQHCKEFPYEKGRLSGFARYICGIVKSRHRKKRASKK
ncbi:MAG: YkgJ family cysteine cluster protein [Candidatus Omnitrophota bacterium]